MILPRPAQPGHRPRSTTPAGATREFRLLPARWQIMAESITVEIDPSTACCALTSARWAQPARPAGAYWWLALAAYLTFGRSALCSAGSTSRRRGISPGAPVSATVKWAQVNLYEISRTVGHRSSGQASRSTSWRRCTNSSRKSSMAGADLARLCRGAWSLSGAGGHLRHLCSSSACWECRMPRHLPHLCRVVLVAVAATVAVALLGIWAGATASSRRSCEEADPRLPLTIPASSTWCRSSCSSTSAVRPASSPGALCAPADPPTVLGIRQADESGRGGAGLRLHQHATAAQGAVPWRCRRSCWASTRRS